jgi:hypothetical protein
LSCSMRPQAFSGALPTSPPVNGICCSSCRLRLLLLLRWAKQRPSSQAGRRRPPAHDYATILTMACC